MQAGRFQATAQVMADSSRASSIHSIIAGSSSRARTQAATALSVATTTKLARALWIVPLTVLVYWLHQSPGFHLPRLAFWRTIGGLSALGLLLDIVFGHTFFRFPNAGATLEVFIWSMDLTTLTPIQNLPIEEIAFYFFGIAFTFVLYIWSDLHWFGEEAIGWSATTVYSVSFLLFWLVISTASALTQLLAVTAPAQDLGHWPRPV